MHGATMGGSTFTGTTGSVVFLGASGTLAEDNANFFWDNTNDRLGIGTNAPGVPLHVLDEVGNTNTVITVAQFQAASTGTAAAGFGAQIRFTLEDDGGSSQAAGTFACLWTNAGGGTYTSNFTWTLPTSGGALKEALRVGPNGVQGVEVALTDGANIAVDASLFTPGSVGRVTMGGNRQFDNPTNPRDRQLMYWEIFSTASRTITWDTKYKGSADLALPAATTGSSKTDMLLWRYNLAADQWWLVAKNFGFAA